MPVPRFQPGLLFKLALCLLVFSLPALLVLDGLRTVFEFHRIVAVLDSPAWTSEIQREAKALARQRRAGLGGIGLERDLQRWMLALTQVPNSPFHEDAIALLEFATRPFSAALIDASGNVIARTSQRALTDLPDIFPTGTSGTTPQVLLRGEQPRLRRIHVVALDDSVQPEYLVLQTDLQRPLPRLRRQLSFEWPVVLADGLVFALAAALFLSGWVTRRLRRISATADAWRRGDFALRIDDPSNDEIGRLAAELDTIPAALAELVETRAALAGVHERERIARDLHDTIKQQTFALAMQLGALRSLLPAAQRDLPALHEARLLVEQIQQELAEMLLDLRPLASDTFSQRLANRVDSWSRRSGIGARSTIDAASAGLTHEHQAALSGCIDEALANVERHSGARLVRVDLVRDGDRWQLRVRDDGHGGVRENGGRGLTHLRERAAALPDGQFDWHSDAGGSEMRWQWKEIR